MSEKSMSNAIKAEIRDGVREVLNAEIDGLKNLLTDISYRIKVLYDAGNRGVTNQRIGSRDLNLCSPLLDGFVVTDNSPTEGSIAWTDCHIVYKGETYQIANGNTAKKYVWWDYSASPNTVFQSTDVKPTLSDDDVLCFVNSSGVHQTVMTAGKMLDGSIVLDGTITGTEFANGAVTESKIAAGAVTGGKIAETSITAGKLAGESVTESKIASGAVTSVKIADTSITTGKLAGGAVTSDKIGQSAVTSEKIGDGAVVSDKIGAGQVAASKLNTALHMIY